MIYFLESIAQSLQLEFGNTLNRHCLVFPNRRAGLYFLKYLASNIDKAVWAPSILTINELFGTLSTLQTAGNELLLFELYKDYRKLKKSPESFDEFYFWGDMLLNDFDDVDKYLVDASALFRNVSDLKNIDQQFGGLTETQVEIIKRFWINFDQEKLTNEKTGFISIWSILHPLYLAYRKSLKDQNLAYEGMILRGVVDNFDNDFSAETRWDLFHFIGFNALNECEKKLMKGLKKAGKARFYWDYDNEYLKEGSLSSAGFFLQENLKMFGNDMPESWSCNTMLSVTFPEVKRRVIETSSDVAQAKLVSRFVSEISDLTSLNAHHTAVILADENLLMPVLTSLPDNKVDINITMGYPLKQTLVYTLVRHLMELQRTSKIIDGIIQFNSIDAIKILNHSLMNGFINGSAGSIVAEIVESNQLWISAERFKDSEYLSKVFSKPLTPSLLSDYFKEILSLIAVNENSILETIPDRNVHRNILNENIYRIVLSVNRLESIVNSPEISFTTETYMRILDRMLRNQSIPFSGEPLSGIQIMGILETRALDFKNLIILSVNEGVLPAISAGTSYIPFSLRNAFGLPSINHQESIYAYHFYRLMQRAENITFTYNSNSEGLRSGEMSRFILQMKYNKKLIPEFIDHNFEIKTQGSIGETIQKSNEHVAQLISSYFDKSRNRILTPSAINTWLNCRMKFYYRYVNGLKEPDKISTDIDPALLGNILHEIMRKIYLNYIGQVISGELLQSILRNNHFLEKTVDESIRDKMKGGGDGLMRGNELIVRNVLLAYVRRILTGDKNISPFTIQALEESYSFKLNVIADGKSAELVTGGIVDRVDIVSGVARIVDYKTGSVAEYIDSIDALFEENRKSDTDCWLQTLLYCESYIAGNKTVAVRPSVYKIKKMTGGVFSEMLRLKPDKKTEILVDNYNLVRDEFLSGLKGVVEDIFSIDEPFVMTADLRGKCSYCIYRILCLR